jgi:hypothetical protein
MTDLPHSSVQAHTARPVHRQPASLAPVPRAASFPLHLPAPMLELCVVLAMCCLLLVAVFAPAVAQPEAYHLFADDRAWVGVPFAMDVLSNAAFVAGGAWGLWRLGNLGNLGSRALSAPVWVTAVVFFGGLLFTGMGSAVYHWQPEGGGLMVDRAAMSVAFAGLLGLAVADRVSGRAAMWGHLRHAGVGPCGRRLGLAGRQRFALVGAANGWLAAVAGSGGSGPEGAHRWRGGRFAVAGAWWPFTAWPRCLSWQTMRCLT